MLHPSLRRLGTLNQLGQPTGDAATTISQALGIGVPPPNPAYGPVGYGQPQAYRPPVQAPMPPPNPAFGPVGYGQPNDWMPTAGTAGAGTGVAGGAGAAAQGNLFGLGKLPPELAWMNNPALQALVKKMSDAGQTQAASALQAQADQATQRAEAEAKMIQGFYSSGAQLASKLSPYYQDVLEKSANTVQGLAGAYGQTMDQLAPGQGAVFNELTGTEPASAFNVQRTAVPFGPGARGDLYSVYGPTTSDIGSQEAAMRLAQGETDRSAIERQLRDLQTQAPGRYLQALTSLAPAIQASKELTQRKQEFGKTYGLQAKGQAQEYGLNKAQLALATGQAVGVVNGKPTLAAQQLQEDMRKFNKDYTLRYDEQGRLQNQFEFTKKMQIAQATGMYEGNPTADMQEAMKADARAEMALNLQKRGLIDARTANNLDRGLRREQGLLQDARENRAMGDTEQAEKDMQAYRLASLQNDSATIALQAAGQQFTEGLQTDQENRLRDSAEQSKTLDSFNIASKIASDHNQPGLPLWTERFNASTGKWEAYQTNQTNPVRTSGSGKQTLGGYDIPKTSDINNINKVVAADTAIDQKTYGLKQDGTYGNVTVPHKVADYSDELVKLQGLYPQYNPEQLGQVLNKFTNRNGQRIYRRGGPTGRPLFSTYSSDPNFPSEAQILAGGPTGQHGQYAKSIMAEIQRDNPRKKWVNDPTTGNSYRVGSPDAMRILAGGGVLSKQPIRAAIQGGRVVPGEPVGEPPKGWHLYVPTTAAVGQGIGVAGRPITFKDKDGREHTMYKKPDGTIGYWPPFGVGATVVPGSSYGGTNTPGSAYR
jgi:hypothetical protein